MEAFKVDAFRILLFVIPGIISLRLMTALAISRPRNPFNMTIDGVIFTVVDHFLYGMCRWFWARLLPPEAKSFLVGMFELGSLRGDFGRDFRDAGGYPLIFIALIVGVVSGVARYHGWIFTALRRLKMTNKTGENLIWADVLSTAPRRSYAVVACKDGSRFIGFVDTFSEDAGDYEVFLTDASQVETDGTLLPIHGNGVLLTKENPITRVEFWNPAGPEGRVQDARETS
jgi:hypothetical protein